MTTAAVTFLLAAPLASQGESAAVSERETEVLPSGALQAARPSDRPGRGSRSETCRAAREAVPYYRHRTWLLQLARRADLADRTPIARGKTCRWARYAAREWAARRDTARKALNKWTRERTLRDFAFGTGDAWPKAVQEVQKVFPGSSAWMLSCSDAEGWSPGFDRWVLFGGRAYYTGAEYSRNYTGHVEVGGPAQYTYGTFSGHFRHGLAYLLGEGYLVPAHLRNGGVVAWRSALGQAIAMGGAYHLGLRGHHWSASYGRGC